jgi:hypothetical protein
MKIKKIVISTVIIGAVAVILFSFTAKQDVKAQLNKEKKAINQSITVTAALPDPMEEYGDHRLIRPASTRCDNYLLPFEVNPKWQEANKIRLRDVFLTALTNGLTGEELEHVAYTTEIYPANIKELIGLYSFNNGILPMISGNDGTTLDEEMALRLFNFVLDGQVEDIEKLAEQGLISDKAYIITPEGPYSLIATILTANTSLEKRIKAAENIIALDTTVTYIDLFVATEKNMPVDFIEKLWLASKLDASFVLMFRADEKSLAQVAMENKNVDLLDFWLTSGNAAVIEPFETTLLDLLSPAIHQEEQSMQSELFLTLMRHNVIANKKDTRFKLKAWLPKSIYNQFPQVSDQQKSMSKIISQREHVQNNVKNVFYTVLQPLVKNSTEFNVDNSCFMAEGRRVLYSVFKELDANANLSSEQKISEENKVVTLPLEDRLLDIDVDSAMTILGENKDLSSKYAIVKFKSDRVKEFLKTGNDKVYSQEEYTDQIADTDLISLAEQGKWKAVLSELSLKKYSDKVVNFVIFYAVDKGAELPLIIELQHFVRSLNTMVMHAVVRRGDVNLARELNRYGLDFSQSNNLGANATYTAVAAKKVDMLRYLIMEKNISIKPYPYGFDPLDKALLTLNSINFVYVSLLINAGAVVEKSHKEIVTKLANNNFDMYLMLISKFPMLK